MSFVSPSCWTSLSWKLGPLVDSSSVSGLKKWMQLLFSFVMVSGLYRFFVVLVVLPVFASLPKLKLPGIIY